MLKKKKSTQTMFPFLFDVSKCKKVKILTPVRMRPQDHAKRFFLFCFLQCDKELDGTCLVGKCHFFTKAPHRAVSSFLQVNNLSSGFYLCVFVLLGRHMELKNLAARFHSATSRISTNSSFSTAHCRGLRR